MAVRHQSPTTATTITAKEKFDFSALSSMSSIGDYVLYNTIRHILVIGARSFSNIKSEARSSKLETSSKGIKT